VKTVSALKWETSISGRETAGTSFGSYYAEKETAGGFRWGYCFDEYYDEDFFSCDSIDEGKAAAQQDWNNRTSDMLEEAHSPVVDELLSGLRSIVERADNGKLGTSKVQDMKQIAAFFLAKHGGKP
jgi:hypothetical protein